MPNRRGSVARVGVEPTNREGLSFAALPVCVPRYSNLIEQASPIGFEPTISTVTGWRALRAALRGRTSVAQVGVEPTASAVLSRGGLPVAYRAMCLLCPKQESNLQTLGFKPSRSASWRIRAPFNQDANSPGRT